METDPLNASKDSTTIDIPEEERPPLQKHSSSLAEIIVEKPSGNGEEQGEVTDKKGVKEENELVTDKDATMEQNNSVDSQQLVSTFDTPRNSEMFEKHQTSSKKSKKDRPSSAQVISGNRRFKPPPKKRPTSAPSSNTKDPIAVGDILQRFSNNQTTLEDITEDKTNVSVTDEQEPQNGHLEKVAKGNDELPTELPHIQSDVEVTAEDKNNNNMVENENDNNTVESENNKNTLESENNNDTVEDENNNDTVEDENNNDTVENENNNNVVEDEKQGEAAEPALKKEVSFVLPTLENEEELPWAMYQKMKDKDVKEDSDEDESSDTESEDEKYVAAPTEDLPDLYEVLDNLNKDDIELNSKSSPPPIFEKDTDLHKKEVSELKQGLAEEEIKVYLDEFEERVQQEILMIGNISLEDVQEEEHRLREEHITFQQQQAVVHRQKQQEIMQAMERAKKYVMTKYKEKYRELRMREQHLMQKDRSYKDEIHRAFRRSESHLRKALKKRKAEVKTMYGDLTFADGQYGGSKGRRWKIDWNRTPQPIQIKLKCLRGVKDKLPGSRYVLMVSLYNRLGGNVMKWSNLKGQQWGGATLPIWHDGEFFNIEMKIDQSVFTVCPSRPDMRPGMVLLFELFILRGAVTPTDKVVGWGCFPVCDAEFNVIEGKYKSPLMRGDMDPSVDKFEVMEKLMADDLENWLCNFYFEIIKLPRYMAGQKEYEVELQFTSGLLGAPDRTKTADENIDGEKAIFGSKSDLGSSAIFSQSSRSNSVVSSQQLDENSNLSIQKKSLPNVLVVDSGAGSSSGAGGSSGAGSSRRKSSVNSESNLKTVEGDNISIDQRKRKQTIPTTDDDDMHRPLTSVAVSRALVEEQGVQISDNDDSNNDSDYDDHDVYKLKKDEGFKPVKGQPGMFYKLHHNTPSDIYARKMFTLMPKTPLLSKEKSKKKLSHLEQLDRHSYCVKTTWSNKGRIEHKGSKKMQYMGRMLLSELGISQVKTREFWAMILMLLLTYWIRMYCHYIGQWVALLGFLVPLNKFEFLPYTVNLNYQNTLLRTREEIALIVIGPFTNILLLATMVLISAFIQFLFERFPNTFSRFTMAFGLHCIFDPIWILITDSAMQRYENRGGDYPIGDAFKLYWHFDRFYNNDNVTLFVSIALTTFLYFVTIFCSCVILYMYFLKIHNNGRLMDIYWRLHGKDGTFFMPYDLECSLEELTYVCRKAENWRGEEGERRKTAVYDYIWEEEEMTDSNWDRLAGSHGRKTGAKETTTHVSIHTLHLDGLRELYRHFLRLPDGAIVEVFGEMNIPGIDEGVKQALIKRTTFQTTSNDGLRKRSSRASSASSFGKQHFDLSASANPITSDRLIVPGSSEV